MRRINELGRVLFWLGLMTALGGMAVLAYFNFGQAAVPVGELAQMTAVTAIGAAMMAVSIVMDLIFLRIGDDVMGEWGVTMQVINGEEIFQVYRLRDVNCIDHSGNREYCGGLFSDETAAQEYADKLNREGPQ